MRRLLSVIALVLVSATVVSAGHPRMSPEHYFAQLAANNCYTAGQYVCSADCDQVLLCVSDGEGGFNHVVLEQCSDSTRCSADDHTCVTSGSACGGSTAGGITCHIRGLLPDPYDCTVYHICAAENTMSLPMTCDPGWGWDVATSDCSKPLTDEACINGPVDTCRSVGQTGTVAGNPSIYYICVNRDGTLIPDLYKCAHGQEYHPAEYACVNSSTPPTTQPPTQPPPTQAPPTRPPDDPSGPTPGGWCPVPRAKVADPYDCTRYFECSPNHTWLHVNCIIAFYYNPVHEQCELGFC